MRDYFVFILIIFIPIFLAADQVDNLIEDNKFSEAKILLQKKIEDYPADVDLRLKYALVLSWDGEFQRSIEQFKYVLNDSPYYLDALNGLSNVYIWTNQYKEAISVLKKMPKTAENYAKIAKLYSRLDDRLQARRYASIAQKAGYTKNDIPLARIFRFETGITKSFNKNIDDWNSNFQRLLIYPDSKSSYGLYREEFNRYLKNDVTIGLISSYKISRKISTEIEYRYSQDAALIPIKHFMSVIYLDYLPNLPAVPFTGFDWARYQNIINRLFKIGFDYYLPQNFTFGYKYSYLRNSDDFYSDNTMIYVDKIFSWSQLKLAWSTGFEITESIIDNELYSNTITFSAKTPLFKNTTLLTDYSYYWDENKSVRQQILLGLRYDY